LNSTADKQGRRYNIVVVEYAGQKAGLVVDELLGEHQTVIKPLGKVFQNLKGISGATILGSGEVAMIIDVPGLIRRVV
jgi:two-component system chemotaxis sensor kinase CheA